MQRRPVWVVLLIVLVTVAVRHWPSPSPSPSTTPSTPSTPGTSSTGRAAPADSPGDVDAAFAAHARNQPVTAVGVVQRVLPDDTQGLRHQRFILRVPSGLTVMVAHDIDQAPRVPDLEAGAALTAQGEYLWNPQGGIVHWTHHDRSGRHAPGWIDYRGQRYQ
ncbi:MAG TPA: DUF3465 domain-containing protein [Steroidobacteraceae bacterium]|nr:DUF3465 domain-containing protein [Steroidobacteraceae bacterium]